MYQCGLIKRNPNSSDFKEVYTKMDKEGPITKDTYKWVTGSLRIVSGKLEPRMSRSL